MKPKLQPFKPGDRARVRLSEGSAVVTLTSALTRDERGDHGFYYRTDGGHAGFVYLGFIRRVR